MNVAEAKLKHHMDLYGNINRFLCFRNSAKGRFRLKERDI